MLPGLIALNDAKCSLARLKRQSTPIASTPLMPMKQDKTTGSLEVGKRADLVVLDRDILTVDPETIGDTKVLATYLDGRLVHSSPPSGNADDDDEDEEPGNWGTSARCACATGCTGIDPLARLVGAHHHAFEGHALELGAGALSGILREAGEARAVPLRVVLLEGDRDRLMAVEEGRGTGLDFTKPAFGFRLRGERSHLHVVGARGLSDFR